MFERSGVRATPLAYGYLVLHRPLEGEHRGCASTSGQTADPEVHGRETKRCSWRYPQGIPPEPPYVAPVTLVGRSSAKQAEASASFRDDRSQSFESGNVCPQSGYYKIKDASKGGGRCRRGGIVSRIARAVKRHNGCFCFGMWHVHGPVRYGYSGPRF